MAHIKFKFRKLGAADCFSGGRGRDAFKKPATWALMANGHHIATFSGRKQCFMEPAWWDVRTPGGKHLMSGLESRGKALEWVKRNLLTVSREAF